MTKDSDFKALVRARMETTGETYTAARAALEERQASDEAFYAKTIRSFFDGPRLVAIPAKRRARVAVLLELLDRFDAGRTYTEREVNEILGAANEDYATLRRELIDYRYLARSDGEYWVSREPMERDAQELQEVPAFEARRLAEIRSRAGQAALPRVPRTT